MVEILQRSMPDDLVEEAKLPGVRPLTGQGWLCVDDAYSGQIAYRRQLIARRRDQVLHEGGADIAEAVAETFDEAMKRLPGLGFSLTGRHIRCPDGSTVDRDAGSPLAVLGRVVQEDICILHKRGDEHVLAAAVLCFPASWTLAEKLGRPLSAIHGPVASYDKSIAARVQRLFDGVQVGQPLWRNNMLWYDDPDLFQPRSESAPKRAAPDPAKAAYRRAERQCILRLPITGAVVFSIHSYVVAVNR